MKKILLTIILILIMFFTYKEVSIFFEIDSCLDLGGSFDYSNNQCIKE